MKYYLMLLLCVSLNVSAWEVESKDSLHNGYLRQQYENDHPNEAINCDDTKIGSC